MAKMFKQICLERHFFHISISVTFELRQLLIIKYLAKRQFLYISTKICNQFYVKEDFKDISFFSQRLNIVIHILQMALEQGYKQVGKKVVKNTFQVIQSIYIYHTYCFRHMRTTTLSPRGTRTAATQPWPLFSSELSLFSWSVTPSRSHSMFTRHSRYEIWPLCVS